MVKWILENSKKMLKATIDGNTKLIEELLHDVHNFIFNPQTVLVWGFIYMRNQNIK